MRKQKRKSVLDGVRVRHTLAFRGSDGRPQRFVGASIKSDRKAVMVWESDYRKIVAAVRRNGL